MSRHEDLLSLARSQPASALKRIDHELTSGKVDDITAIRLRQAGAIAARLTGDIALSNQFLAEALRQANTAGDERGAVQAQITRAGNALLEGRPAEAVDRLVGIGEPADPELAARRGLQLGTVYARTARFDDAIDWFTKALEAAQRANDDRLIAVVTKNRGMLRTYGGEYAPALADLQFARSQFKSLGIEIEVAYCDHNLGLVADYSGRLQDALALFTKAEDRISDLAGSEWEVQASRCDALIHAGLAEEAADLAATIAERMRVEDHLLDHGEALVAWAHAEIIRGDFDAAASIARTAAGVFASQDRADWRSRAELLTIKATSQNRSIEVIQLDEIAETLRTSHFRSAWLDAELAAARVLVATDPEEALRRVNQIGADLIDASVDLRLADATVRALAWRVLGNRRRAARQSERAYRTIRDYQGLLSAGDLQVAVRQHGEDATRVGLELAVESGRPRRIFDWLERMKWSLLQTPGISPRPDQRLQEALAAYRALDAESRRRGKSDNSIRTAKRRAEARVRDSNRLAITKSSSEAALPAADVIEDALRTSVLSYGFVGDQLLCVKLRNGRATKHLLGNRNQLEQHLRAIRTTLNRRLRGVPSAEWSGDAELLAEQLVDPVAPVDDLVLILPPPSFFGAPWRALGRLTDHRVMLAPSATAWRKRPTGGPARRRLLVAGPDLVDGDLEISLLARAMPNAQSLTGDQATVGAVTEAISEADVLHIAAHGTNRSDSPLFSSLRLFDGPLSVYDLTSLPRMPHTVVLSACHVGLDSDTPGKELLGLVGGLLRAGARTVIASTLPLPDTETTVRYMATLHSQLASGTPPSAAVNSADDSVGDPAVGVLYKAAVGLFGGD